MGKKNKKTKKIKKRWVMLHQYTISNYSVYSICRCNTIVAYAGIFKDGRFNYVIIETIYLKNEQRILKLIRNEVRKLGLEPALNPGLY